MYLNLYEVVYAMDADPAKPILYRGVKYFDRQDRTTIFNAQFDRSILKPVEAGILHAEFRFWGQDTKEWKGASTVWDSSRSMIPRFHFFQKRRDPENPDYVYPEMVQVTLIVRSQVFGSQKVSLIEDLSESAASARISTSRDLADPPGMVKIGSEWVEYRSKGAGTLSLSRRGAMGTAPKAHPIGAEVMFGDRFTRTFPLVVRQEAVSK
jgi:hypothetical protein